ncbi:MAG TPA: ATP-binding cassette domain-containing protein, partial [Pseudomonadales bacterium]|nr:ATP-binding cassette domain-containing protein [Pseudomonadales bacterium]
VARGEFWVIGAPQHSGKSDFLMTTAGLMPPAEGRYRFFGNETRIFDESRLEDRLRMGFVFENAQLFHYLTIAENVALPLRYHKNLPAEEGARAIDELLEITELKAIADVMPANSPRSWHKRAALARALVLQPDILLADNPLGALDARHSLWWLHFFDALNRDHKWLGGKALTVIATTDDFRPWRGSNRRFALLKDTNFIDLGSWNDVISSNDPLVKELLAAPIEEINEVKS